MTERSRPTSLLTTAPQQRYTGSPQSGPPSGTTPRLVEVVSNSSAHIRGRTKKSTCRSFLQSPDNRYAVGACLTITLTACVLLRHRDSPLYSARIPPPHARPVRRRRRNIHPLNHTISSSSLQPTNGVWDPMLCEVMIERTKSIQLLALDFDQTIVDVHTGGRWEDTAEALTPHVRPSFPCLISHCLQEEIKVAITTFSKQKELIGEVLQQSLQQYHDQKGQQLELPNIPVFGGEDWIEGHTDGKQSQLLLAMQHFNHPQKSEDSEKEETDNKIRPESTLLVDDDRRNIEVAELDGYQTILFPAEGKQHRHHHRHRRHHGHDKHHEEEQPSESEDEKEENER